MLNTLALALLLAAQPAERIPQLLARYYPANEPGAVVLVEQEGKTILRKAYGLADVELQTPMKPEHLLKVGSISKQFTSVAILKLAEAKKLALEDKASRFLPDVPHDVTVEQLLTHTSGVAEYTAIPEYGAALRQDATVRALDRPMRAPAWQWRTGNPACPGGRVDRQDCLSSTDDNEGPRRRGPLGAISCRCREARRRSSRRTWSSPPHRRRSR